MYIDYHKDNNGDAYLYMEAENTPEAKYLEQVYEGRTWADAKATINKNGSNASVRIWLFKAMRKTDLVDP